MKFILRMFYVVTLTAVLAGCGSNSDDKDLPVIGTWVETSDDVTEYYLISNDRIVIRSYINELNCHSSFIFNLLSLSDTAFTTKHGSSKYVIKDDKLSINDTSALTRTTSTQDFISCLDPDTTGTLNIAIEFENLPNTFTITEGTDEDIETFNLSITFDLSPDNSIDDKELSIIADYNFKGPQSSSTVSIKNLLSQAYLYSGGDSDRFLTAAPYTVSENTITFSFARNDNKILKEITNTSAIQVSTLFNDLNGNSQYDAYPETGFTQGIELTNAMDATGDVSGNYSTDTIVDIKSVTVTVKE